MIDDYPPEEIERTKRRGWILRFVKKHGVGAEFGVFRGHYSEVIAKEVSPSKLYLVDPWRKGAVIFEWGGGPETMRLTRNNTLTTEEALLQVIQRMAPYPCAQVVEDTLEHFCQNYPSYGSPLLDFAYLDTSHTYEDTVSQLRLIETILAPAGVICGDDWQPEPGHIHHGVFRAVNEFVKERDFQFVAGGNEEQFCIRRNPRY